MINRQAILDKFDGHCAYCGKEITLKEMQVDHIKPLCNGGTNDSDNLNPSCRRCNHYKRSGDTEVLRWLVGGLIERLKKNYIFKVALDYGLITLNEWNGKFYFERGEK